ncbi:hypothetical protein HYU23_01090 [Candidatus Woesearchaeota archaeon]|nr:hypothetical protein [Candidatus Woesearchaeota archaeon]
MEKRLVFFIFILTVLLIIPIVSAGFFDFNFFDFITGRATTQTTTVNITIANTAPIVINVTTIAAQSITEAGITNVSFDYVAADPDGAGTLTAVQGHLNRTGETDRYNATCQNLFDINSTARVFRCTVPLYWFDGPGTWSASANVTDSSGANGSNGTISFTLSSTIAFVMAPSALTWPSVSIGSANITASNDPILMNNTGNANVLASNISINSINLMGESNATTFINVSNFTVDQVAGGSPLLECDFNATSGIDLRNNTYMNVSGSSMARGNFSINNGATGQEQLYFCLTRVMTGLTQQSYSTFRGGSWTLQIA